MPRLMVRSWAVALGPAFAGAALLHWLGVPAGALIGSSLAVTGAALVGLGPAVPQALRSLAFATIGVTLGSGVTPHILSDLMRFPVSLAGLTATMAAVMLVSGLAARRLFGLDPATAFLGTSPGAVSYSISLSLSAGKSTPDPQAVMTLQSLRLLLITVLLPPLIGILGGDPSGGAAPGVAALALLPSLVLIALGAGVGLAFARLSLPAAFLLAGFVTSGIAHGMGAVEGRPSPELTVIGFALAGAVIGERFARITRGTLRRLLLAGLTSAAIAMVISGLASGAIAFLLDLPLGQVWVAFAPGGVESMGAMAIALDVDPVYVATHHIFRILLLFAILPVILPRLPSGRGGG